MTLINDGKAPVDASDELGRTALYLATWEGHTEAVNVLVQHPSCDFSITDCLEHTAVDIARSQGHVDVAALIDAKSKGNG